MIWKETKQQPDTAEPGNMLGCCLNSFHFLWGKLSTLTVQGTGYQGGSQHVPKTLVLALIFPKKITRLVSGSYKVALIIYTECTPWTLGIQKMYMGTLGYKV